jgi:hypothetical protein
MRVSQRACCQARLLLPAGALPGLEAVRLPANPFDRMEGGAVGFVRVW